MQTLLAGTRVGGRQLVRQLRAGEGRQVFSSIELSDDRQTIVKLASLAHPADVDRLEREFAVLRDAAGPGVVPAIEYTVSLSHGMACLVLAAHGPSLASILASAPDQRLTTDIALAAMHATANSLAELHARGWRHGDLKPGNLLCNADGSVTLSDLEFALRLGERFSGPVDLRRSGTPPFMAPELWQANAPDPSTAADAWALGVTLYFCLFGTYPFGHEESHEIAAAIERGLPESLAELPESIRALLRLLMARDPAKRPRNGREISRLIVAAAKPLGIDLVVASRALGRMAEGLPDGAAPSEPRTMFAVPTPAKSDAPSALDIASVLCAPPPPPHAAFAPAPPPSPPQAAPRRPEGIGAASSADNLLDRMQQFLDIASDIAPAPAGMRKAVAPASPAPIASSPLDPATVVGPVAAAPSPPRLVRRAAARWFRRMNPEHNFPLSIVFSGKEIRIVGGSGLGVTLGRQEIVLDHSDPVLNVEPWFPGCIVSPPRADVHVTEENTVCRFWITPLARGDLTEACVTIRYRGKVVETLATPAKVVTRTPAKLLAGLGVAAPFAGKALSYAGWEPESVLRQSLPYAANLASSIGPIGCGLCVTGLLLTAAVFHFYVTRPLMSGEPEPSLLPQRA